MFQCFVDIVLVTTLPNVGLSNYSVTKKTALGA